MYKKLIIVISIFFSQSATAQWGIRASYGQVTNDRWEAPPPNCDCEAFSRQFSSLGLDYTFRLKNKRLEFYPELSYTKTESFGYPGLNQNLHHTTSLRLVWNTQLYPLDFGSDCDCPTWSNSNDFFKKAFFVFLAPEIGSQNHLDYTEGGNKIKSNSGLIFGISGGVGLDIGFSDFFKISPILRYGYLASTTWNAFNGTDLADDTQFYGAEIRFGFKLSN